MRLGMIRVVLGTCLMLASFAIAQEWSEEIFLGGGLTPDLDVDPTTGHLHIVHHNNGLIYTEVDSKGNILRQENVGVASGDGSGGFQFGATVAVDPRNGRPHICFRQPLSEDHYHIYYTRMKTDGTWRNPLRLVDDVLRAYSVRMEVDNDGVAHIVHGSSEGDVAGPAAYIRVKNDAVDNSIGNLGPYRADDRVEIAMANDDILHLLINRPDDLPQGGPVTYFSSADHGNSLDDIGDVHASNATGRNGNGDIFPDQAGKVHIVYGSAGYPNGTNGPRNLHYARYRGTTKETDVIVTDDNEILFWENHALGVGSVAASDDGKSVVVAYVLAPGEQLRVRLSTDGGQTFSSPASLSSKCGGSEGRDKHIVRARGNSFYLVYPTSSGVKLRILNLTGPAPVANAGGPYSGNEGSAVTFNGSNSTDEGGQIVRYKWDWTTDGVWDDSTAQAQIQHTYQDNFTGNAILEVVDNEGLRNRAQASVTIANVAPRADAGGPYSAIINQGAALTGNATDAGSLDTHTFKWDLDNNGTFETSGKTVNKTFSTAGSKLVRLQATDDDGGAGGDTAFVEVGSGGPVISTIPNQTVQENRAFTQIQLDNFVSDPNHDKSQLTWSSFGASQLLVSILNRVATVSVPDSEWAGAENISFAAKDPDNLRDTTVVRFTVTAVNDLPRISNIPFQAVDEGKPFESIKFDDFVLDPDHPKGQLNWSAQGNVNLVVNISNRIATVAPADSEWSGQERVTFVATDPAGGSAQKAVQFTIRPVNDPPRISSIPDQRVAKGAAFPPLDLTPYVIDPDGPENKITVSASGQNELSVFISGMIITVLPPTAQWEGSEKVIFTAKDSLNAAATDTVKYSRGNPNTAPRWLDSKSYSFDEDDTLAVPLNELRSRVADDEDPPAQFQFAIAGNQHVKAFSSASAFSLHADPNWNGVETVQLLVHDGAGARDTVATQITVRPVVDALSPFGLIFPVGVFFSERPDTIDFTWEPTSDPDNLGSGITYLWILARDAQFTFLLMQTQINNKSRHALIIDSLLPGGILYWKVVALSGSKVLESQNFGLFTMPAPEVSVEERKTGTPTTYQLRPNFPNPFNPQTTIAFDLPKAGHVTLTVYSVGGEAIANLRDGLMPPGYHEVVWDASGMASGMYFVEIRVADNGRQIFQARQKMSLVR